MNYVRSSNLFGKSRVLEKDSCTAKVVSLRNTFIRNVIVEQKQSFVIKYRNILAVVRKRIFEEKLTLDI